MVSRYFAQGAPRAGRPRRHRFLVLAPAAGDVVRFAGGLVFDKAMGGWEVTVVTPPGAELDLTTQRALRILGAQSRDLETVLTGPQTGLRAHGLAVDARLCTTDPRVRRLVNDVLEHRSADVRFWSAPCLSDPADDRVGPGRHELSLAARAFKAQALAAARIPPEELGAVEVFGVAGHR